MLTQIKKFIPLLLAITVLLSSCNFVKRQLPDEKLPPLEKYLWANEANSQYGYYQLDERLREVYRDIADAWISLDETVSTRKVSGDEIHDVMTNIMHDYPLISWVEERYTYANNLTGGTSLNLEYTMTASEANLYLTELNIATDAMLEEISPSLSDYEKAVIVHDKLIQHVTYDLEASHQKEAYGALIDQRATCLGYARAYQLLLLKLGIDTQVVYGDAGEPHAWNIVKLDDDYYFVDATFDDRELIGGGGYLSHEYLFLDDSQSMKTHIPSGNGTKYMLPVCDSTEYNYFLQNKLIVSSADTQSFLAKTEALAMDALENRKTAFQLKIETAELAKQLDSEIISTGIVDTTISIRLSDYRGVRYTGRTFEEATNVYTFLIEFD